MRLKKWFSRIIHKFLEPLELKCANAYILTFLLFCLAMVQEKKLSSQCAGGNNKLYFIRRLFLLSIDHKSRYASWSDFGETVDFKSRCPRGSSYVPYVFHLLPVSDRW